MRVEIEQYEKRAKIILIGETPEERVKLETLKQKTGNESAKGQMLIELSLTDGTRMSRGTGRGISRL